MEEKLPSNDVSEKSSPSKKKVIMKIAVALLSSCAIAACFVAMVTTVTNGSHTETIDNPAKTFAAIDAVKLISPSLDINTEDVLATEQSSEEAAASSKILENTPIEETEPVQQELPTDDTPTIGQGTITVNGIPITLSQSTFSVLFSNGWNIEEDSEVPVFLTPKTYIITSVFKETDDTRFNISLTLANPADSNVLLNDSVITQVSLTKDVEAFLPQEVSFQSTVDDVKSKYGECDVDQLEDYLSSLTYYCYDTASDVPVVKYVLSLTFKNNVLSEIEYTNTNIVDSLADATPGEYVFTGEENDDGLSALDIENQMTIADPEA